MPLYLYPIVTERRPRFAIPLRADDDRDGSYWQGAVPGAKSILTEPTHAHCHRGVTMQMTGHGELDVSLLTR